MGTGYYYTLLTIPTNITTGGDIDYAANSMPYWGLGSVRHDGEVENIWHYLPLVSFSNGALKRP